MSFLISLPKWYYILEFPYVFECVYIYILDHCRLNLN